MLELCIAISNQITFWLKRMVLLTKSSWSILVRHSSSPRVKSTRMLWAHHITLLLRWSNNPMMSNAICGQLAWTRTFFCQEGLHLVAWIKLKSCKMFKLVSITLITTSGTISLMMLRISYQSYWSWIQLKECLPLKHSIISGYKKLSMMMKWRSGMTSIKHSWIWPSSTQIQSSRKLHFHLFQSSWYQRKREMTSCECSTRSTPIIVVPLQNKNSSTATKCSSVMH